VPKIGALFFRCEQSKWRHCWAPCSVLFRLVLLRCDDFGLTQHFFHFTPLMRGGGYYVFTTCRCPDKLSQQHRHLFRFARILNGFQ